MKTALKFSSVLAAAALAMTAAAAAQSADIPPEAGLSARIVQLFLTVTVLSLAPGIAIMATSLPFIVIALSILRQGIGLQQAPPNMLIMGLALFLTFFVMEPVLVESWKSGVAPLADQSLTDEEALKRIIAPFASFMSGRVDPRAVETLSDARGTTVAAGAETPIALLVPAFVLSEIQRAFEVGFVILLPFLIIDLLVASVLMAMGMVMVPPSIVALPFKLCFFIMTNGWVAVSGALVRSYA
jgi:flagellar biosynthetic protein FliP